MSKYKVGDKVVMEITGVSKHGGCHATCEPYKDYKIKHEAEKAERDKEKYEHLNANDFKFAGMKRMQRGRRK